MPSIADHYSRLLGGVQPKVEENKKFFQARGITPKGNRIAVDLGCGSGFQSLALAQSGFRVPQKFVFEILEVVTVKDDPNFNLSDEVKLLEQLWLEKLQPYGERGYNTRPHT